MHGAHQCFNKEYYTMTTWEKRRITSSSSCLQSEIFILQEVLLCRQLGLKVTETLSQQLIQETIPGLWFGKLQRIDAALHQIDNERKRGSITNSVIVLAALQLYCKIVEHTVRAFVFLREGVKYRMIRSTERKRESTCDWDREKGKVGVKRFKTEAARRKSEIRDPGIGAAASISSNHNPSC